jgi:hypothetical protein
VVVNSPKVDNVAAPQPVISDYEQLVPYTLKPDPKTSAPDAIVPNASNDSIAKHSSFSKNFEAGVKGGYESGFSKNGASKFVVSPYLQYNLSNKFSLMTQPAIKLSHMTPQSLGSPKMYYDVKGDSTLRADSGIIVIANGSGGYIRYMLRKYDYRYTYDSTVKSYSLGGTYVEFELPILLKYKINKQLSVYGGVNVDYSKLVQIQEKSVNYTAVTQNAIVANPSVLGQQPNIPPSIDNAFLLQHPGYSLPIYKGPMYPSPKGDLLRMGYMLGFSYEYKKRWMFDVLVQQAMVKPSYTGGHDTNAPFELPYFRLTAGYKLTK